MTGHNKRVGIGAEAWTDYLKFSTNGYFGTTNWHQSRDFEHYNERPADGYDIRAEAYIPSYAQFGGKLMYEKYKGMMSHFSARIIDKEILMPSLRG